MTHEPEKWGAGQGGPKKNLMQKLINESAHNLLEMTQKMNFTSIFLLSAIMVSMNCLMLFKFVANLYIVQPQGERKIFFFGKF
jgi:hypothetical protein